MIEGVVLRDVIVRTDERGHLAELYSTNFGDKLCHVYRCMVRPGVAKAFHCHLKQTDRFSPISGVVKVGLVDLRGDVYERLVNSDLGTWEYMAQDHPRFADKPSRFTYCWETSDDWLAALDQNASRTFLWRESVILDASRPQVLFIPPGVAHGIYALNGQCAEILNAPTVPFNREAPDELRMPADSFVFEWEPKSR